MDFRRLQVFSAVYESRSFSKAGERLFLSQPTVSAHVASLEKELDAKLFDRLNKTILPTPAGDTLYAHCKDLFDMLDRAKAEVGSIAHEVSGRLSIGGSTIPGHYLLPRAMAEFQRLYPKVEMELAISDSRDVIRRVAEGGSMLGVIGARKKTPGLRFVPVYEDELVVVSAPSMLPPGNRLAPAEMKTRPWVLREEGSGTGQVFEQALAAVGQDIRELPAALVVGTTLAVLECVRAGLGLGVISRLAAASHLERGDLVEVMVDNLVRKRTIYAVYNEQRHHFPAARMFLHHIEAFFRTQPG